MLHYCARCKGKVVACLTSMYYCTTYKDIMYTLAKVNDKRTPKQFTTFYLGTYIPNNYFNHLRINMKSVIN